MSDVEWRIAANVASHNFVTDLTGVSEYIESQRLGLYSISYDWLNFGNWRIVFGTRYQHFELFWDGKEGQLFLRTRLLRTPKGTRPGTRAIWKEIAHTPTDESRIDSECAFAIARQLLIDHLPSSFDIS